MPKKKTRKKKSASIPDLDRRITDARDSRPRREPEPDVLPPAPEDDDVSPSAALETLMEPERAATLEGAMRGRGRNTPKSLQKMMDEVRVLEQLPGPKLYELLVKQLDLACIQGISAANDSLKMINDEETTEVAREVLVGRLVKLALFNESASRQRLSILKAGYIEVKEEEEQTDPADLSNEEWEKQYGNHVLGPGPATNAKQ